jgi:hypothetical protein
MLQHTELYKPQPIILNLMCICMLWSAYYNLSLCKWELKNSWMDSHIILYCQISWNIVLPFEFLYRSDNFNEHCAWKLTSTWNLHHVRVHFHHHLVHAQFMSSSFVLLLQNHERSMRSIRFPFLVYRLLGVGQVWWKKWRQNIILNYWRKQRQRVVSNK